MAKILQAVVLMNNDGEPTEVILNVDPNEIVDKIDGELGADYTMMEIVPIVTVRDVLQYAKEHGHPVESEIEELETTPLVDIEITSAAMDVMTRFQQVAIQGLISRDIRKVHVQKSGLDLPEDHLMFRLDNAAHDTATYGSIAPDGTVTI